MEKLDELLGIDIAAFPFRARPPLKLTLGQSLMAQKEARSVIVDQLHVRAASIPENKDITASRIILECGLGNGSQFIDPGSKVNRRKRNEDGGLLIKSHLSSP